MKPSVRERFMIFTRDRERKQSSQGDAGSPGEGAMDLVAYVCALLRGAVRLPTELELPPQQPLDSAEATHPPSLLAGSWMPLAPCARDCLRPAPRCLLPLACAPLPAYVTLLPP